jgi:urease accessory protein
MVRTMAAQVTATATKLRTVMDMTMPRAIHTTTTTTAMATELLQLIWLASPALPVGGFSYSEALEAAIDHEHVHDEASCADWLADQLHLSQARGDMALMAQAIPAWQAMNTERLNALSQWVHATRETQEMRLQTEQMGRSLLDWLRIQNKATAAALKLCSELRPSYPMAMSLALSLAKAPLDQALQAYAFGWAENMTQAALKAVPLGQVSGQKILARLAQEIPDAVQHAIALSDDERQAFCPMLAVMSARHETQYSRLFRS